MFEQLQGDGCIIAVVIIASLSCHNHHLPQIHPLHAFALPRCHDRLLTFSASEAFRSLTRACLSGYLQGGMATVLTALGEPDWVSWAGLGEAERSIMHDNALFSWLAGGFKGP